MASCTEPLRGALRLFGEYVAVRLKSERVSADSLFYGRTARTKECPRCLEDAWSAAQVCPHCGYGFPPRRSPRGSLQAMGRRTRNGHFSISLTDQR